MNRKQRKLSRSVIITLLAAFVVLLLSLALFGPGSGRGAYSWEENYKPESKQPYGTYVIKTLLSKHFDNKAFHIIKEGLPEDLPAETEGKSSYVFIGEAMYLDSADVARLLDFVDSGNDAFIFSKSMPFDLMFHVYFQECDYVPWDGFGVVRDTVNRLNLYHPDLAGKEGHDYKFLKGHQTKDYRWHYLDSSYFCGMEMGFVELGYSLPDNGREYVNFAKIRYRAHGEEFPDNGDYGIVAPPEDEGGFFYIHTTPLAFTNFQLLDSIGKSYADKVFSHIDEGDIYWDQYGQVSEGFSARINDRQRRAGSSTAFSDESPLKYILGNRHLSWAWYSTLALGLLFLLFAAKRRQREIPVMKGNTNSSLEFVSTMGALYFNKRNHRKLCLQKMKMFLAEVRHQYQIPTKYLDKRFVEQLSKRSGVDAAQLSKFIRYYQNIERSPSLSDESLRAFHEEMQAVWGKMK